MFFFKERRFEKERRGGEGRGPSRKVGRVPSFVSRFAPSMCLSPHATHLHHQGRCCSTAATGRRELEPAWRLRRGIGCSAADECRRRSARGTSGSALVEAPSAARAAGRWRAVGRDEFARCAEIDRERFSRLRRRHFRSIRFCTFDSVFFLARRLTLDLDKKKTSRYPIPPLSSVASFNSKWIDSINLLTRRSRLKLCFSRQRETAGNGQSTERCSHQHRQHHRHSSPSARSPPPPPPPRQPPSLPLPLRSSASPPLATSSSRTPRPWPSKNR